MVQCVGRGVGGAVCGVRCRWCSVWGEVYVGDAAAYQRARHSLTGTAAPVH